MKTSWLQWLPLLQPPASGRSSGIKAATPDSFTSTLTHISPHRSSCAAIVASGITKKFEAGGEVDWVLRGVDLEIPCGTLQFLLGPSGVGKTTLLSILAGILTPTSGTVTLLGQSITALPKCRVASFRLEHVGFIFQEFNLISSLTVFENVELAMTMKGIHGSIARQQARELLNQVNLSEKSNQLPRSLSGGEKQRVAIARALAGKPCLIFADEPTSALDFRNGQTIVNLFRQLTREQSCTVLMATHDHRFSHLADRVLQLEDGQIIR
jgi:putative ABC transport system ATP-binding protein